MTPSEPSGLFMRLVFRSSLLIAMVLLTTPLGALRPLFTTVFPPSEFAEHRAGVFDAIGDAVAVVQGAPELPSYLRFRQNNHFFYLTGVETPRALVLLDGRTRTTTLFLAPANEAMVRSEGPVLVAGADAERLTGVADVRPRDAFRESFVAAVGAGRTVYTPFRGESIAAVTPDAVQRHAAAAAADPWDGQPSREATFREKLAAAAPGASVRDLDPILDKLRVIKTAREIAAIRESTRVAGLAMAEAMRSAAPGMHEHDIEAIGDWIFKSHGAQGIAYFGLVATGANAIYPHYHAGTDELKDGDLVLFDYAPDIDYYSSDVTRMFPANGHFSPTQRELYGTYVKLYSALMAGIRPGAAPSAIIEQTVPVMDRIVSSTTFSRPAYRAAAERFVDGFRHNSRNRLGHFVGMEVHDVSTDFDVLKPGMVFTIEPQLVVPEERLYFRLEDVIVVTPGGYENLSAFVPVDMEGIEKTMAEAGRFEPQRHTESAARR